MTSLSSKPELARVAEFRLCGILSQTGCTLKLALFPFQTPMTLSLSTVRKTFQFTDSWSPQRVRPVADKVAVLRMRLHAEPFAQIELAADWVVDEEILGAFAFDPAFIDQVGAIDDR
jgi:hypothetical protein